MSREPFSPCRLTCVYAGVEPLTHASFWESLMRIYVQLKFGTQSPALSPDESKASFNLKSQVSLIGLAQSLSSQLGVKLSTRCGSGDA